MKTKDQLISEIEVFCKQPNLNPQDSVNVLKLIQEFQTNDETRQEGLNYAQGDLIVLTVSSGNIDFLKLIVEGGADPHINDDVALRAAADNGHLNIVKYLVEECYADPSKLWGTTEYDKHEDVRKYLYSKMGSITPNTVYDTIVPLKNDELARKLQAYKDSLQDNVKEHTQNVEAELKKYNKALETIARLGKFNSGKLKGTEKKTKDKLKELEDQNNFIDADIQASPSLLQEYGFIKIYQNNCKQSGLSVGSTPIITHYGIDAVKTKELIGFVNDELHPVEKCLLVEALKGLNAPCSAITHLGLFGKDTVCPNNVVLLDIFVRKDDPTKTARLINLDQKKKEEIETHTVVLWKTKDNEITIIDPTNQTYGAFLANKHVEGINYKIVSGQKIGEKLYNSGNDEKNSPGYVIYKASMKPRDCTDIAVKIGFELNERQKTSTTIEEVRELTIEQISNQRFNKGNLKIDNLNTRPLQSSDFNIRQEAKKVVDEYSNFSNIDFKGIKTIEEMNTVVQLLGELKGVEEATEFIATS